MEALRPQARRLEGRVALVTGAASRIGAATAGRLAGEGAALVLTDVCDEAGGALVACARERGSEAVFVRQAVDDEAGWVIAVAVALTEFGRLDVLVNGAGLVSAGGAAVGVAMRVAADSLKAGGHGSVIDIRYGPGGALGPFGPLGVPVGCDRAGAPHRPPEGVRVNYVRPGFFDTPVLSPARPSRSRAEQVAACVAFLASDDASFITGLELYIDGLEPSKG